MRYQRRILAMLCVAVLFALGQIAGVVQSQEADDFAMSEALYRLVADVRSAVADFHDIEAAMEAEYGKFLDCFTHAEIGGMGQHYVNGELAGDRVLDPLQPEALVYAPTEDGELILVALEYLVFADVWDPEDEGLEPPTLFNQEFRLKTNIPETPPVWTLHIWIGTHNPEGLFADYNPTVFCPADAPIIDMS